LPDVFARKRLRPGEPGRSFLSAAKDGKRFVFIAQSQTEPRTPGGAFNFELFLFEGGTVKQLTNVRSHLAHAHISYDGSTVAFGSDPTRSYDFDLFILDLTTGEIRATGLREKLAADAQFARQ
jgi:Tol biopolymer transport system component